MSWPGRWVLGEEVSNRAFGEGTGGLSGKGDDGSGSSCCLLDLFFSKTSLTPFSLLMYSTKRPEERLRLGSLPGH